MSELGPAENIRCPDDDSDEVTKDEYEDDPKKKDSNICDFFEKERLQTTKVNHSNALLIVWPNLPAHLKQSRLLLMIISQGSRIHNCVITYITLPINTFNIHPLNVDTSLMRTLRMCPKSIQIRGVLL